MSLQGCNIATLQITNIRTAPTEPQSGKMWSCRSAQKSSWPTAPITVEPYQTRDKVWLKGCNLTTTTHPTAKLAPRCYGPFTIPHVISQTTYQPKLPPQWKIHNIFHATLLTCYKEMALNGSHYQEPAPELIDGQPEWEVEYIMRVRKRCNQLQYLVRWKGFFNAHDSSELTNHIHAHQLI